MTTHAFLKDFMHFARNTTGAERAFCADVNMNLIERVNLDDDALNENDFLPLAEKFMRQAEEKHLYLLTNNAVISAKEAPTTNTNFSNLRTIVIFPIAGHGFVYLDHPVTKGVFSRMSVDRLAKTLGHILEQGVELNTLNAEFIGAMYEKVNN